jgi:4'-phosphopantetheinyl transferase
VWWAPADAARAASGVALMNRAELRRHEAMLRPAARAQFALGCLLLRVAAARELGCPPGAVELRRDCPDCDRPHGKPALPEGTGLELSLSHTDGWVICAVSRTGRVGVDIEERAPAPRVRDGLADRILTPAEAVVYRSLPEGAGRNAGFCAYWARKEAVLKADGRGLRVPLSALDVSRPDEPPALLSAPPLPGAAVTTLHTLHGPAGPIERPLPQARVLAHIGTTSAHRTVTVVEAHAGDLLGTLPDSRAAPAAVTP